MWVPRLPVNLALTKHKKGGGSERGRSAVFHITGASQEPTQERNKNWTTTNGC